MTVSALTSRYSVGVCKKVAQKNELRYVTNTMPGLKRCIRGKGFIYYDEHSKAIKNKRVLSRIEKLAIPPAWKDVWICPFKNGHLQATGIDEKNRKQYLYHTIWQEKRHETKFEIIAHFGKSLPILRKYVLKILKNDVSIHQEKIIALLIFLLDHYYARIGNVAYAEQNKTFGLTTLTKKHIKFIGKRVELSFPGKNKTPWTIKITDKKILKNLKKCEAIPGYFLFQYKDEDNKIHHIDSSSLNEFIKNITQHPFTAKDFRTWAASLEMFNILVNLEPLNTIKESQQQFKNALCQVATLLGHTPTICKKSYIAPVIIEHWSNGQMSRWYQKNKQKLTKLNKEQLFLKWWNQIKST